MPEGDLKPGGSLDAAPEKAPMSFGDSSFDSIVKQAVTGLQADSAETRQTLKANAGRTNDVLTRLEASDKDKPKLPEIAPPEKPLQAPTPTSAYEQFGSAASVLATLGALATRRPLVAALNASAGAMKALQTRDAEGFKQNLETWKANSEYAGKYAQWQLDRYKSALENHKGTQESLFGQLRAIASIDQDAVAQHAMQTGDLQVVEKFMADRQTQIERYENHRLKLDEFSEHVRHDKAMEARPTGTRGSAEIQTLAEIVKRREQRLERPLTDEEYIEAQREASISYQNTLRHDDTTRRGQDKRFDAAQATLDLRKELGEKADLRQMKSIEGTQWYREQLVGLKALGLTEAGAKRELEERVAQMRDDTTRRGQDLTHQVTEERVQNDKLYRDEVLKLRGRGLSDSEAKEKALEEYRTRALEVREKVSGAKHEQAVKQTDSLLSQTDSLLDMIDKNPSIVGTRGKVGGALETIKGLVNPRAATDPAYQRFETAMKAFRTEASLAISQSKYYSGARMAEMAKTLPALENFTSAQDATAALTTMRSLLQGAKLEVGEAPHNNLGTITQADLETTARENGMPIDAVKRMLREKGFDVP